MKRFKPDPHPLDFEWLFSVATVNKLSNYVGMGKSTLAIGVPTVAEELERRKETVLLVDRQPMQDCVSHVAIDANVDNPLHFVADIIILDPPWYPDIYRRWLSWAAQHATTQSEIICALWPEYTRPGGAIERSELVSWLQTWSTFELVSNAIIYETPEFELQASRRKERSSARSGDLLIIKPVKIPMLTPAIIGPDFWHRFIIDEYQLAIKTVPLGGDVPLIRNHPLAEGWIWLSTSLRAPGRREIGLWSSNNEVAIVGGADLLVQEIRKLVMGGWGCLSKVEINHLLPLKSWNTPLYPPERVLEWTHHA